MSGKKWTKGDWWVDRTSATGAYGIYTTDDNGNSVPLCHLRSIFGPVPREERDANADLMRAAPKLFEACKFVMEALDKDHRETGEILWVTPGETAYECVVSAMADAMQIEFEQVEEMFLSKARNEQSEASR